MPLKTKYDRISSLASKRRSKPFNRRYSIYTVYFLKLALTGACLLASLYLCWHYFSPALKRVLERAAGDLNRRFGLVDVLLLSSKTALIVDPACLQNIASGVVCSLPIQIATSRSKMISNESPFSGSGLQSGQYSIEYWIEDDPTKDFLIFREIKTLEKRATKRFKTKKVLLDFGQPGIELEIPENLSKFIVQWKNGRFIDCTPFWVRNATESEGRYIPLSFASDMSAFAEHVSSFNVTPFIFGGTLLGWYRECSIIPHTPDVDFGMLAEQHSIPLLNDLINSKKFVIKWILGRVEDSLELTVWSGNYGIDLFYVYYNKTRQASFTSGMRIGRETRQRIAWIYPKIHELCSVELLGHLFNVPCNYEAVLKADYGEVEWRIDHHSNVFYYDRSHKNHESMEHFSEDEWLKVKRSFYPRTAKTPKEFIP